MKSGKENFMGRLKNLHRHERRALFFFLLLFVLAACNSTGPMIATPHALPGTPARPVVQATSIQMKRILPVKEQELPDIPTSTPSPKPPTPTPPTPLPTNAPLTKAAMAACPVSLPNLNTIPKDLYITIDYWIGVALGLGNPEETLFTMVWPGGKLFFSPNGPGEKNSDGSLAMKWPWYRTLPGDVVIGGRRLDAPGLPMPEQVLRGIEDGYDETGFHPSTLVFPGAGCWEVTARVGEARLTFVTLVVKIAFDPLMIRWIPEGLVDQGPDLSDLPQTFRSVFASPNDGKARLVIETSQGVRDYSSDYREASKQQVTVKGGTGICVQDALDDTGHWQNKADAGALAWSADGLSYRISTVNLKLTCEELLRITG